MGPLVVGVVIVGLLVVGVVWPLGEGTVVVAPVGVGVVIVPPLEVVVVWLSGVAVGVALKGRLEAVVVVVEGPLGVGMVAVAPLGVGVVVVEVEPWGETSEVGPFVVGVEVPGSLVMVAMEIVPLVGAVVASEGLLHATYEMKDHSLVAEALHKESRICTRAPGVEGLVQAVPTWSPITERKRRKLKDTYVQY